MCIRRRLTSTLSDHTDFSESTDEIAPLTEEEKKARLEELRQKLAEKRANLSAQDKEEAKRNEVSRSPVAMQPSRRSTHISRKSAKSLPRSLKISRKSSSARSRSRRRPRSGRRSLKTSRRRDASRPRSRPIKRSVNAKKKRPRRPVRVDLRQLPPLPPPRRRLPNRPPRILKPDSVSRPRRGLSRRRILPILHCSNWPSSFRPRRDWPAWRASP